MRNITKANTTHIQNAKGCEVFEYPFDDKDINGSIIAISGRYPEAGYALNKVCKELVYIIRGSGVLGVADGTQTEFQDGDSLLIEPNEKFFWQGDFESYMVCTPAFSPEQHIELTE